MKTQIHGIKMLMADIEQERKNVLELCRKMELPSYDFFELTGASEDDWWIHMATKLNASFGAMRENLDGAKNLAREIAEEK